MRILDRFRRWRSPTAAYVAHDGSVWMPAVWEPCGGGCGVPGYPSLFVAPPGDEASWELVVIDRTMMPDWAQPTPHYLVVFAQAREGPLPPTRTLYRLETVEEVRTVYRRIREGPIAEMTLAVL